MKRVVIGVLLSTLVAGVLAYSTDAEAQRSRRGQQRAEQVPQSEGIAQALGELRWGMSDRQVYNHFVGKIRAAYRERLSEARDAMEEDRLRNAMNNEIRRIRRSYVRFDGETTGWDVSFLRDEFTHGNRESMLAVRDSNSQNFYFFVNNRLWKWYKAFDAEVFAGQNFRQFTNALQGRFGDALERNGRLTDRGAEKRWLEWQDARTRLRAVDENRFYGFYCMVFEDKATVARLDELRANSQRRQQGHALVDAVTQGTEAELQNQDIVDRITGRIRRRTHAEEPTSMGSPMQDSAASGSSGSRRPSSSNVDDDPLSGLDF